MNNQLSIKTTPTISNADFSYYAGMVLMTTDMTQQLQVTGFSDNKITLSNLTSSGTPGRFAALFLNGGSVAFVANVTGNTFTLSSNNQRSDGWIFGNLVRLKAHKNHLNILTANNEISLNNISNNVFHLTNNTGGGIGWFIGNTSVTDMTRVIGTVIENDFQISNNTSFNIGIDFDLGTNGQSATFEQAVINNTFTATSSGITLDGKNGGTVSLHGNSSQSELSTSNNDANVDASHGERSEGEYSEIGADFYRA